MQHIYVSDYVDRHPPDSQLVGRDFPSLGGFRRNEIRQSRPADSQNGQTLGLAALELVALPSARRAPPGVVGPILDHPPHPGAGGRSRAMSDRMSWNICRGTATSAIWKVT